MRHIETLISLVGKQPMPVLIPIVQYGPSNTLLVATEETRKQATDIREAVRLLPNDSDVRLPRIISQPVDPYRSEQTSDSVAGLVERYGSEGNVINITGGTSLMALGAFHAARAQQVAMLYVSTDGDKIIHLKPEGLDEDEICCRVPVKVYLRAHGAYLSPKPWGESIQGNGSWVDSFIQMAKTLGQAGSSSARLMDTIRRAYQHQDGKAGLNSPTTKEAELALLLKERNFLSDVATEVSKLDLCVVGRGDHGTKRVWDFLTGKWLELFVFDTLQNSGVFDEVQFAVEIKRPTEVTTVKNELDVIFMKGSRLGVISCKTELHEIREKKRNKIPLYELDSLLQADLMGLYAGKMLVTNQASFTDAVRSRALLSEICLVTGSDLPDLVTKARTLLE